MRTYEHTTTENGSTMLVIGVELADGRKFENRVHLDGPNGNLIADLVRLRRNEFIAAHSVACVQAVAAHQLTDTHTASSTVPH